MENIQYALLYCSNNMTKINLSKKRLEKKKTKWTTNRVLNYFS